MSADAVPESGPLAARETVASGPAATGSPAPQPPLEPGEPQPPAGPARSAASELPAQPGPGPAARQPPAGTPGAADRLTAPPRTARPRPAPAGYTSDGIPKLARQRNGAMIGGVAAGIAEHIGVPVLWVRAAFAVLAAMSGAGVVAYALLWIFVPMRKVEGPEPPPASARQRRQAVGVAAIALALLIVGTSLGLGSTLGWALGPLGVAAVGAMFVWREADDARRARWRRTAAGIVGPSKAAMWRLVGGIALVIGGLAVFAIGQLDFTAARSAIIAVLLTLVGVAVITVPWWLRLVRDLGDERRERIHERERAEIAAHLHDSVLQTLALIQRQAHDSKQVLRLARGQERELRSWLYGPTGYASPKGKAAPDGGTLAASLAEAAGEVEDTYAITVAPVVVGDAAMDQGLAALVAAAREAMVNAAKHSGSDEVSVYAEVEDDTASVFVRDRGAGFDPDQVSADRRGLSESIRGRMERHGGRAAVRSKPGEGTEVELSMPVKPGDKNGENGPDRNPDRNADRNVDKSADKGADRRTSSPAGVNEDVMGSRT